MAGYEKNKQRQEAMQLLGKDLARRASRKCEICEAAGVRLDPWEVPPAPKQPEFERTLLLCEGCSDAAEGGKLRDPSAWRCLETIMWSDITALQVTAVRMLRRLDADGVDWATAGLESVYLSEEAQEWLDA